jgi:signal transduction histidine kinase/DNA-binding LytR/AlgR family response regulator
MFVLVVDHQLVFQKMLAQILDQCDAQYELCSTGQQALAAMKAHTVSLFVISMNMPDISGEELCYQIRQHIQDECIPVVVLTSYEQKQRFRDVFKAGATDVFHRDKIECFGDYVRRLTEIHQPIQGRVMILEDSLSQQQLLKESIVSWGLEVDAFAASKVAFQAHLNKPYDVILTDIELAGLESGLDFVHDVRQQPLGIGDVPIMAVTAYLSNSTRVNFLARGIDCCMLKPLLMPELRSTLKNQIEARQAKLKIEYARQKEKQASEAKSNFIARTSHELRTSLNAIIGFSKLLLIDKNNNEETYESARKINEAGEHLLNLINEVLDLSKIESGKLDLKIQSISVRAMLKKSAEIMSDFAQQHQVRLDVLLPDQEIYILCDEIRLLEIIFNLISNAVKYSIERCVVTVSANLLDNNRVRINVADNGIGIDPADADKIFQPFSRVYKNPDEIQGSGIGLAISKQLVELMNGSIDFTSEPGVGSCFWVDLPVAHSKPEVKVIESQKAAVLSPCHVVYVDDNPVNQLLIKKWFSHQQKANLQLASSAREGLAIINKSRPDIVLTDISMPGESGYWLLETLRAQSDTAMIPVVALSARAMAAEVEEGASSDFDSYLTKPIDFGRLAATIQRLLNGREK